VSVPDGLILDIYARVSRLGDDRQRSTTGQVEDCQVRVDDRGAQTGEIHIESGRSAWNPRVRRPAWERLMERLESGVTGGVIVFDMARFSRRPIEGERLILAAERGMVVLDSEGEYDLNTANGRKTFRDQLNNAAYESDRLSTRVKRGKRIKAARGEPLTSHRPYGFEKDGVTIRETEAVVLREMTARLLAGESKNSITIDLNKRGKQTATGGTWAPDTITQVLKRPRNAGLVEHLGEIVSEMPGTPILDPNDWRRVLAIFAARRRGRPISEPYLCSGEIYCGLCGHHLTGRPNPNRTPYEDGSVRRQYWCQKKPKNGGCYGIIIDQREVDKHIGAVVVSILANPRHSEAVEKASKAANDARRPLEAEIAECEQLADDLSTRLGRGEIKLSRYEKAIAPLDLRIDELTAKLAKIDATPAAIDPAEADEVERAAVAEWSARWDSATTKECRVMLRQALTGRRVIIKPAEPGAPRRFDPELIAARIVVDPEKKAA